MFLKQWGSNQEGLADELGVLQLTKRNVSIRDDSGASVDVTLWGNTASDPGNLLEEVIFPLCSCSFSCRSIKFNAIFYSLGAMNTSSNLSSHIRIHFATLESSIFDVCPICVLPKTEATGTASAARRGERSLLLGKAESVPSRRASTMAPTPSWH